jgi:hypothetical protein
MYFWYINEDKNEDKKEEKEEKVFVEKKTKKYFECSEIIEHIKKCEKCNKEIVFLNSNFSFSSSINFLKKKFWMIDNKTLINIIIIILFLYIIFIIKKNKNNII